MLIFFFLEKKTIIKISSSLQTFFKNSLFSVDKHQAKYMLEIKYTCTRVFDCFSLKKKNENQELLPLVVLRIIWELPPSIMAASIDFVEGNFSNKKRLCLDLLFGLTRRVWLFSFILAAFCCNFMPWQCVVLMESRLVRSSRRAPKPGNARRAVPAYQVLRRLQKLMQLNKDKLKFLNPILGFGCF